MCNIECKLQKIIGCEPYRLPPASCLLLPASCFLLRGKGAL
jgi:hypothetical protein